MTAPLASSVASALAGDAPAAMPVVADGWLFLIPALPLLCALVLLPWSRGPGHLVRIFMALTATLGATALAVVRTLDIGRLGSFAYLTVGGFVGARLEGSDPLGLMPLALHPGNALSLVAVMVAASLCCVLLAKDAWAGRTSAPLVVALLATGFMAYLCLARELTGVATAFALSALAGFGMLTVSNPKRLEAEGAARALWLHLVGDVLLFVAVWLIGDPRVSGPSGIDATALAPLAATLEPWARATEGPLAGFAQREIWLIAGALVALAAATRLALFPLLLLVRDAIGAPPGALGFAHGVCFGGAGLILLQRFLPFLALSPEVLQALVAAGCVLGSCASALALVGRDLVRIDVHLCAAACALGLVPLGAGDDITAALWIAVVIWVAVPLFFASASVVRASGHSDPFALGGLERVMPRTHTMRLLATAAWVGPLFTGAIVFCHGLTATARATWLGLLASVGLCVATGLMTVAAFRPLHLVFTGSGPRAAAAGHAATLRDPQPWRTWPLVFALLPTVGVGLVHLPRGALEWIPGFSVVYDPPLAGFLGPDRGALLALNQVVLHGYVPPPASSVVFFAVALLWMVASYGVAALLYRGGPSRLHAALGRSARFTRVTGALAQLTGSETHVGKGVSDGAARLSRIITANLAPAILDLTLRRVPALVAALVGAVTRFLGQGSAQRGLFVALCTLVAVLLWWVESAVRP